MSASNIYNYVIYIIKISRVGNTRHPTAKIHKEGKKNLYAIKGEITDSSTVS
jgi:hypothetical protein